MVHWPGDPVVSIPRISDMDRGDVANVRRLSMSAHTGTHMDAPLHFIGDGASIDAMPLDAAVGPARVIEIDSPDVIGPQELDRHDIRAGERILLRTGNSERCWRTRCFLKQFVHIGPDGAEYLASRQVRLVGIDYLSVGAYGDGGVETHRALLSAGIWIIEGLDLSATSAGNYELICLPLKISGGDGAPARAVVRRLDT